MTECYNEQSCSNHLGGLFNHFQKDNETISLQNVPTIKEPHRRSTLWPLICASSWENRLFAYAKTKAQIGNREADQRLALFSLHR